MKIYIKKRKIGKLKNLNIYEKNESNKKENINNEERKIWKLKNDITDIYEKKKKLI